VRGDLFKKWLNTVVKPQAGISLYTERPGARSFGLAALKELVAEHFVGERAIAQTGGYTKSAAIIANSLPTNKRTRSGDLGELLATEYLNSETPFVVPIKKLRWKSDREMAMHGNDVIGVDTKGKPTRVLKGECKSRAAFGKSTMDEAAASLDRHDGRPNPSTLAFITKRLYEENRDAEAKVFQALQSEGAISSNNVSHLIFALAGNAEGVSCLTFDLVGVLSRLNFGLQKQSGYIGPARRFGFLTASRKRLVVIAFVSVVILCVVCVLVYKNNREERSGSSLKLTSVSFQADGDIPSRFTCDAQDVSPGLNWAAPPAETRSFALIADDPDAPTKTIVHWVLYDLPAGARSLPEGIAKDATLPDGSRQGTNDHGTIGYSGPCPPRGATHHYFFKLYALDSMIDLKPDAGKEDLERAMEGHILAQSQLIGRFTH
jgi:Raf kinase inhibitor-like YbhB/YbcL family protein